MTEKELSEVVVCRVVSSESLSFSFLWSLDSELSSSVTSGEVVEWRAKVSGMRKAVTVSLRVGCTNNTKVITCTGQLASYFNTDWTGAGNEVLLPEGIDAIFYSLLACSASKKQLLGLYV